MSDKLISFYLDDPCDGCGLRGTGRADVAESVGRGGGVGAVVARGEGLMPPLFCMGLGRLEAITKS